MCFGKGTAAKATSSGVTTGSDLLTAADEVTGKKVLKDEVRGAISKPLDQEADKPILSSPEPSSSKIKRKGPRMANVPQSYGSGGGFGRRSLFNP